TSTPPPEGSTYETRAVDNRRPAPQAGNEAPAEDPGCAIARGNLALLNGLDKLGPDEDGDGRPDRTYTEAERADQVALAEAAIKVRCTTPPAPAAEREEEPEETGDNCRRAPAAGRRGGDARGRMGVLFRPATASHRCACRSSTSAP